MKTPRASCPSIALRVASHTDPLRFLQGPLPNLRYGKTNNKRRGYHAEMSRSLGTDVEVGPIKQ